MDLRNTYIKIGALVLDMVQPKRVFMENIFKTKFSKTVLICYLTHPFYRKFIVGHTNQIENIEMTKVFNEMKFNVDVCRYDSQVLMSIIPMNKYGVIIGMDPNFEKLVKKFKPGKAIYYATGSYFKFQNKAEQIRISEAIKKTGKQLYQKRFVKPHQSLKYADAMILIGNNQTKKTYEEKIDKIEMINVTAAPYFTYEQISKNKDWDKAKKNYLWFGSFGAVHKGLDLLLEVFKNKPELNLYICGPLSLEPDFLNAFYDELNNYKNIINCGLIDPSGDVYKDLVTKCDFVILPSCSEGMSGSVATCMNSGLIPIVSRESGIDINKDYGYMLKNNSVEAIKKAICGCDKLTERRIKTMSKNSYKFAKEEFSIKVYQKKLLMALKKII